MDDLARAAELDAADPLAAFRERFLPAPAVLPSPGAHPPGRPPARTGRLDGSALGRPPAGTAERMDRFVREEWGERLIRGWTEDWMGWPERAGDRLAAGARGGAPGEDAVAG